jgi:hypothetical protein
MLSRKYLANQVLSQEIRGPRGSHFWQSLLSVDDIFQQYRQRVMHEGEKALFWEDKWVNNTPRSIQFPRLYHLSFQKGFIVRKLKQEGWDMIKYRRTLFGETLQQLEEFKTLVDGTQLSKKEKKNISSKFPQTWPLRKHYSLPWLHGP